MIIPLRFLIPHQNETFLLRIGLSWNHRSLTNLFTNDNYKRIQVCKNILNLCGGIPYFTIPFSGWLALYTTRNTTLLKVDFMTG